MPHAHVCRFFASAGIDTNSSVHVFRAVRFFKKHNIYLLCPNRLSYTRVRQLIKETLSAIGVDSKGFSTHSPRAGGATFKAKKLPVDLMARTDYLCFTAAGDPNRLRICI